MSESAPGAANRGDLKSTTYELVVLAIQESCSEFVDRQPPLQEPVQKFGFAPDAATEVARGVLR